MASLCETATVFSNENYTISTSDFLYIENISSHVTQVVHG